MLRCIVRVHLYGAVRFIQRGSASLQLAIVGIILICHSECVNRHDSNRLRTDVGDTAKKGIINTPEPEPADSVALTLILKVNDFAKFTWFLRCARQIKNTINLIGLMLLWIASFVLVRFYPLLSELFGMYSCMFGFAVSCLISATFALIMVPETKGKSYDAIMAMLRQ